MIKKILSHFLLSVQLVWISPLLLPFWLTTEQDVIAMDITRWIEILGWKKQAYSIQLLMLLLKAQEFRNLFYFRLFKGNFKGRSLMYLLRSIYRPFPLLFLDNSCTIGGGLFIQHGFSTIIMGDLGENCWINQQVTIGHKDRSGHPRLGHHVRVTAGAKVLGNIQVGSHVTIGANAVVVKDVPDHCVVVGIPARIIKQNGVRVDKLLE